MLAWLGSVASQWWYISGVVGFLAFGLWESLTPDRGFEHSTAARWASHFFLYAAGLALGFALIPQFVPSEAQSLFKAIGDFGGDIAVLVVGVLALDLLLYVLHRLEHGVFVFWRFHAVHHCDPDVDTSTALRHHPAEFVVVGALIAAVFGALGAPLWVFAVFNLLSLIVALFQHINVSLPDRLERVLQTVIVSPAMHRAHHSDCPDHYNCNFGNALSVWDRLFGTYRRLQTAELDRVCFGVSELTDRGVSSFCLPWIAPFLIRRTRGYLDA